MARVLGGERLALEDMPQVAAAGRADDLCAPAVCVLAAGDRPGDLVIEARPAAARVELVIRAVQGRVAAAAVVGPFFIMALIFIASFLS